MTTNDDVQGLYPIAETARQLSAARAMLAALKALVERGTDSPAFRPQRPPSSRPKPPA